MKRALVNGILVTAIFIVTGISFGQGWMRRSWAGCPGIVNQWQKDLELTPEQTKKIDSLQADFRSKMDKLIPVLQEKVRALRELLLADKPDGNKIEATIGEIEKLRAKQHLARIDYSLDIRNALTDEQRAKFLGNPLCPYGGMGPGLGMRLGRRMGRGLGMGRSRAMGMGWRSG